MMMPDNLGAFLLDGAIAIPETAKEHWVEIACDCDGREGPHSNEWRVLGEGDSPVIGCVTMDEDEIVWKWQIIVPSAGGRVANGWGHTRDECRLQAEMTGKALHTDWLAYLSRNQEES